MSYLLDTNALSEINKPHPNQAFMQWLDQVIASELYVSCITIGELYKGIELQPDTTKRKKLEQRTSEIMAAFEHRILVVDQNTAKLWAQLIARAAKKGRSAPVIDALIAAQCIQHQLTLVTRNTKDFEQFAELKVLCPWTDS